MFTFRKFSDINKEWINTYPKTINENGCWIPLKIPRRDGYIHIMIEGVAYYLHRLVISIYHNLNYRDLSWDARHSKGCDRACFFHEHLQPGTPGENARDNVKNKTNANSKKEKCPKCEGEYKTRVIQSGWGRGEIHRYCPTCKAMSNLNRKYK